MNKESCKVCTKVVYPTERVAADEKVYHKSCFRCKQCNNVLKLGSYASMEGEVFCKPCFKKLFFSKGNYSEGFGKLKPQQQHDLKMGRSDAPEPAKTFQGVAAVQRDSPSNSPAASASSPAGSTSSPAESKPVERSVPVSSPPAQSTPVQSPPAPKEEPTASSATPSTASAAPQESEPVAPKLESNPFMKNNTTAAAAASSTTPNPSPPASKTPTTPKSPAAATATAGAAKGAASNKCEVCGKTAYPMEKCEADGKTFHKTCFRCKQCNSVLKLGSFAAMNGEFFCKVCFKKNFFSKGNYSDGFGLKTPQEQHNAKTGKDGSAAPFHTGSYMGVAQNKTAVTSPPAVKESAPAIKKEDPKPTPAVATPTPAPAPVKDEEPEAPKETNAQRELRLLREAEESKEKARKEEEDRKKQEQEAASSHQEPAVEEVQA
eukprot:TRINITY_DN524_c0_g1_i1.p1 TRINITY_DN524_c0_g1~~TRINITY_DN524_c0_g1_i1.p1  ORF type:complete len:433 (-),score=127.61 TRINITY_DN524_c0_g1_i1:224-1522(-)